MKRQINAQKSQFSWVGYLLFFVFVSGVATCSILAYSVIYDKSGGNKLTTALSTLAVLIVLTVICTTIDAVRRKIRIERPVDEIAAATDSITAGDFSVKLKPMHSYGKYDEFDIIKINLNRMASELSKNELLKADFIANVSHEIKTPLALIQNYATGLGSDKLSADERKEYISTLIGASNRITDLITNILKLNKLDNQNIFAKNEKVQLGELMRECVLSFEEIIEQKQLELDCDIQDIEANTDSGLLEIVFNNLLSNAIKFTQSGGKITVILKDEGGAATATVQDSGCGISKEMGERIFDKFYQGDTSHSTQGNGLGLALVKRVACILGAELAVDSKLDEGSSFSIRLREDNEKV